MRRVFPYVPAAVALVLVVLGFRHISAFAVDVPFWDEWEFLFAPGRLADVDLHWLFAQHNEHRIVPTKVLTALSYALDGWNLRHQILFDFGIYATFLAWLCIFLHRASPTIDGRIWPAFLIFLLAPSLHENLLWGFQSQFHFAWFFAFLSIFLIFVADVSTRRLVAAVAAAAVAVYSFSGGLVMAFVLTAAHACFRLLRAWLMPERRRVELRTFMLFTGPVAVALAFWLLDFDRPGGSPALMLPYHGRFWLYLGNLVTWGFGIESNWPRIGWLLLIAVGLPLLLTLRRDRWTEPSTWTLLAAVLAVLGFLGSIAMGRASLHAPEGAKISRYAEIAGLIVPLTAAVWANFWRDQPGRRAAVLVALWFLTFLSFRDDWSYRRYFSPSQALRLEGRACAERFYRGEGNGSCPTVYPLPIPERLQLARELGVSFTRQLPTADGANKL